MSLINHQTFNLSLEHSELLQKTIAYENAAKSPNTLRTYKSMWKKFENWCAVNSQPSLPASSETIAIYIASLGESVSFSTLDSTLAAIEAVHDKAGQSIAGDQAIFRRVRKGIRRTHKGNQTLRQAPPISVLELKRICCGFKDTLKDCRDKALLTLTFFGAFRRSEVVSLDIENITFNEKGATLCLLQSKTSDTKENIYVAFAQDQDICPVKALKAWIEKAKIEAGAVFRSLMKGEKIAGRLSGHAVSQIIKTHFGERFSGHSGRRGLLTASAEKGTPLHIMKRLGRHKSAEMTMRYIEAAKGFEDSAVKVLGV